MSIQDAINRRVEHHQQLRKIRQEASAEIDRLLELLDAIDGDPDLEPTCGVASGLPPEADEAEPDNDFEPSLGSINPNFGVSSQERWSAGGAADLEDEFDGREDETEHGELDPAEDGIADLEGLREQLGGSEVFRGGVYRQTYE